MRKLFSLIKDIWLIVGMAILLFIVCEWICFVAAKIYSPYDLRAELPVYKDFAQRIEFWIEQDRVVVGSLEYVPFSLWSRPPFSGKWTNVNACGDRVTHYNADENIKGVKKIFMFGGSTLWGTGSPDWQTIPSYLAKMLNENESRYTVSNYGETGYVSSQGLNRLISEIKRGNIPDLVIFYSGINDASEGARILAALNSPSYHALMDRFVRVFKKDQGTNALSILEATYIYKAINFFKNKLLPDWDEWWDASLEEEKMHQAAQKTAQYWLANYKIASAIGRDYGFKVIFILQPNINAGKKLLQDYEKEFLKGGRAAIVATYNQIKEAIKENNLSGVYDLSDAFAIISEPIYIDWAHIGPRGNYLVCCKIVKIIEEGNYLK